MCPACIGPGQGVSSTCPVNDVFQFIRSTPVTADQAQVGVSPVLDRGHDLRLEAAIGAALDARIRYPSLAQVPGHDDRNARTSSAATGITPTPLFRTRMVQPSGVRPAAWSVA